MYCLNEVIVIQPVQNDTIEYMKNNKNEFFHFQWQPQILGAETYNIYPTGEAVLYIPFLNKK